MDVYQWFKYWLVTGKGEQFSQIEARLGMTVVQRLRSLEQSGYRVAMRHNGSQEEAKATVIDRMHVLGACIERAFNLAFEDSILKRQNEVNGLLEYETKETPEALQNIVIPPKKMKKSMVLRVYLSIEDPEIWTVQSFTGEDLLAKETNTGRHIVIMENQMEPPPDGAKAMLYHNEWYKQAVILDLKGVWGFFGDLEMVGLRNSVLGSGIWRMWTGSWEETSWF